MSRENKLNLNAPQAEYRRPGGSFAHNAPGTVTSIPSELQPQRKVRKAL